MPALASGRHEESGRYGSGRAFVRQDAVGGYRTAGTTDDETMNGDAMSTSAGFSEGELHERLLQLWRRFLKTADVTIEDDFFERGGDSLLGIDLQLELQKLIGRPLPESLLSDAPTVREMARRLAGPLDPAQAPVVRTVSAPDAGH